MIETQYITLDMKPSGVLPILYCSQYDIGRPLGMVVYNGGEVVELSAYTVTIEATRTDGVAITAAVTTDENIGAFETTATMTNKADRYGAQLVLRAFGKRVASLPFVMCVVKAAMDENAESIEEDESLYQQYTETVQTLIDQIRAELHNRIKRFNTVALMKADTTLVVGEYARTGSYYRLNDGGGALYIITDELSNLHMETLANGLYARIVYEDAVRPECLGAVGDAETDASSVLQEACNNAALVQLPVVISKPYYIATTVNVPDQITIKGNNEHENSSMIRADVNIGVAFNCGTQVCIDGLQVTTRTRTFAAYTAFEFAGDSNGNVDSSLENCLIEYAEKGVHVTGRNFKAHNTTFMHCRYGAHIDIPSTLGQVRGIVFEDNRFHGIGEEYEEISGVSTEMIKSGNCAGILLDADVGSIANQLCDVVIRNNISDQSGTFVKGNCPNCLISCNYIKHFTQPAIIAVSPSGTASVPSNAGSWHVVGNYIYGVKGSDGAGENHADFPAFAIEFNNYGRINVVANDIGLHLSIFKAQNAGLINISDNYMIAPQASSNAAIGTFNSVSGFFMGNKLSANSSFNLFSSTSASNSLTVRYNSLNIINNVDSMVQIGSQFNSGTVNANVADYNHFFIRRTDGESMFEIWKYGDYYTSSVRVNSSGTVDAVAIDSSYKVSLNRRAADGSVSTLGVPLCLMISNQ